MEEYATLVAEEAKEYYVGACERVGFPDGEFIVNGLATGFAKHVPRDFDRTGIRDLAIDKLCELMGWTPENAATIKSW